MRYFLVDFENVSDSGLKGFFSLKGDDQVVLFYTLKANRVSMEFFEAVMTRPHGGSLRFLQVSAGNQALDLQLASFLGSLVAAGESDCEYYIISKDKGFQCLVSFWEKQGRALRLRQFSSIAEALSQRWPEQQKAAQSEPKPAEQKQEPAENVPAPQPTEPAPEPKQEKPEPKPAESAPGPQPVKPEPKPQPVRPEAQPEKPKPQQAEPKPESAKAAPSALPVPAPQQARVAQSPEKLLPKPEPQPKQDPQPRPEASNGQSKQQPQKNQPNEKTLLNTRVQSALSKAKYDTAIISHVASLVAKTFGKPKARQFVYLDLIKEYGQKKGLELYQLVKPLL